ncbi:MAG: hypothetical protein COT74_05170 [Bdellovibrionales bacterium CG10_big_fil_rev_8_21_14_0_10_45_34]|nr:MAG: hypothetical protein COT74_05170 [Bdellovibrionales bacterium CG10_big_fil_rev_8_21_14_0_10_45_34]
MKKVLSLNVFSSEFSRTYAAYNKHKAEIILCFKEELGEVSLHEVDLLESTKLSVDKTYLQSRFQEPSDEARMFLEADAYLFAFPIWNFGLPSVLKAYIDRAIIPGYTFTFVDGKILSRVGGRKATFIVTAGGLYSEADTKPYESLEKILRFLSIDVSVAAFYQGLDVGSPDATSALDREINR